MRAMLAALLLALAPKHIEVRIPETPWVVVLDVAEPGKRLEASAYFDERGKEWMLLAGDVGKQGDPLMLRTVSDASARLRTYTDGARFEVQGLRCLDATNGAANAVCGMMTAHVEAPGLRLELMRMRLKGNLPRKDFESLAATLRVLLLRRGSASDCTEAFSTALTQCAVACPGREAWRKGYMAKHPTDWWAHLAEAEFRRIEKAPPAQQVESYERAALLLSKLTSLKPEERFARALCNEGLGLARYDAQAFPESAAALEQACADFAELKRADLAEVSYELSLSQCRTGTIEVSLATLLRAVAADPKLRERAAGEPYFEGLRKLPDFQKLIGIPPPPAGK
jgi:hypothetical protein